MSMCKTCHARITWAETRSGSHIPVDEDPVPEGNIVLDVINSRLVARVYRSAELAARSCPDEPRYVSHWATCPQAEQWRRR